MMIVWILAILLLVGFFGPWDRGRDEGSRTGVVVLVVLVLLAVGGLFMGGFGMMGIGMHQYGGWGGGANGGWNWSALVAAVLFLGGVGAIAYALRKPPAAKETEEARVLRLRLAKGEITPEEYESLRQKLELP